MNRIVTFTLGCCLMLLTSAAGSSAALPESWSADLQASTARLLKAGLDNKDLVTMTASMHTAGFDDQQIIEAQNVLYEATEQGLSLTPLFDKAQEGLVKHVPAPAIISAMQHVRTRYGSSQKTAVTLTDDPVLQTELVQLLAGAQAAGMKPADLETISAALQEHAPIHQGQQWSILLQDTFISSRDMARRGIDSELANEIITELLRKGAEGEDLKSIARTINSSKSHLSMNERAQRCLAIIASEASMTSLMEKFQQPNAFDIAINRSSPSTRTMDGKKGKTGGGQGGSSKDGTGNSNHGSDSGKADGNDNAGGTGGKGANNSGSSGNSGASGGGAGSH